MKTKLGTLFMVMALLLVVFPQVGQTAKTTQEVILGKIEVATEKVIGIDQKDRTLFLMDEEGDVVSLEVGEAARNFDQIKVGDVVTIKYYESVAIYLGKHGEQPEEDAGMVVARAKKGQMPAGYAVGAVDMSAQIVKIHKRSRKLTLMGPDGKKFKTKVDKNVKAFDNLKVGDSIHVRYTEAIAISVKRT